MKKSWRTVMRTKTVAKTCGCYQQNCACQGQQNCGCCYPRCGCARQYQNVQVPVNEEYSVPVTRLVPVTRDISYDTLVPEDYIE